jgi:hypothetical protein
LKSIFGLLFISVLITASAYGGSNSAVNPGLTQAAPVPSDCGPGRHWTLQGSGIAHCVNNDPVCSGATPDLVHDWLGNPSCVAPVVTIDSQSLSCPAGSSGSITQTRTVTTHANGSVDYGSWSTSSNSCVADPVTPPPVTTPPETTPPVTTPPVTTPPVTTPPVTTPPVTTDPGTGSCTNGATNYPSCNAFPSCANGATNYPACNAFPSCANGATNYPACNAFPSCANGATNYPACNSYPSCANGATNPPTCTDVKIVCPAPSSSCWFEGDKYGHTVMYWGTTTYDGPYCAATSRTVQIPVQDECPGDSVQ